MGLPHSTVKLTYSKQWLLAGTLVLSLANINFSSGKEDATAKSNASSLEITYLGNEGVMISDGPPLVLVDALHGSYREYSSPPPQELETMQAGKFPYNGPEVVLVTHAHGDHFDARSIGLHLEHNKKAILVGPRQVMNAVREQFEGYELVRSQIRVVTPKVMQRDSFNVNGVQVEALKLLHRGQEFHAVQHVGYVVHLAHWTLLHVGDADESEDNLGRINPNREEIDVALLPFWFLLTSEGQARVVAHIRPQHIVCIHIPNASASELEKASRDIKTGFPSATIFATPMQKKRFWKSSVSPDRCNPL